MVKERLIWILFHMRKEKRKKKKEERRKMEDKL